MKREATPARLYLWASRGTPDNPPDRIEVELCPTCSCLIPVEHAQTHRARHRTGRTAGRL
jgi:hypothetical protein